MYFLDYHTISVKIIVVFAPTPTAYLAKDVYYGGMIKARCAVSLV
jgi:hypothetical protein